MKRTSSAEENNGATRLLHHWGRKGEREGTYIVTISSATSAQNESRWRLICSRACVCNAVSGSSNNERSPEERRGGSVAL